ncbi:metalloprotease [Lithospermum erythrorhizon]|uniref:Metalloprotease n=1 Tax=Lithospermum erythrorhizon TaxID=34254 RepID=A0AAV3RKE9_LITER
MTQEDLAINLFEATLELQLKQETPDPPEALNTVPILSLQDIPKKPVHVPTEVGNINGVKVLQHDLFTLDFLYAEVVFNMETLKPDLLPLLPLCWLKDFKEFVDFLEIVKDKGVVVQLRHQTMFLLQTRNDLTFSK